MSEEAEERLMRYFLLTHLCGIFSLRICAVFSPYASVRYFTPHMVLFSYNPH
ncbi:hypothetical protein ECP030229310_5041 [Escherichia coli P0302293.10]|nr:hypothetical protein ECP03052601_4815 [Escherichia coli P0305260.1]ENE34676.1 hypothetical protein ECP030229310_5041 [Escherichia coli P0302293.10]